MLAALPASPNEDELLRFLYGFYDDFWIRPGYRSVGSKLLRMSSPLSSTRGGLSQHTILNFCTPKIGIKNQSVIDQSVCT